MGFMAIPGLALARASGAKIKMVAVNYQKMPIAVFSLSSGANVTSAKQLEGLTLGSGSGSATPQILKGYMAQQRLDPDKLRKRAEWSSRHSFPAIMGCSFIRMGSA
jgi:NitT/TauT family transport system substrate-binding protein